LPGLHPAAFVNRLTGKTLGDKQDEVPHDLVRLRNTPAIPVRRCEISLA
jgi:hypothetical protein